MWWGRREAAKCSLGGMAAAPNEPPTADLWQQRSISAGLLPGRRAATTLLAASSGSARHARVKICWIF